MITLREYGKKHGISYEAARLSVKKNFDMIASHIVMIKGVRYLDEDGERILDEIRGATPTIIYRESQADEVESMKKQCAALMARVIELQDAIIEKDARYLELQERYVALISPQAESAAAAASTERAKEDAESASDQVLIDPKQAETQKTSEKDDQTGRDFAKGAALRVYRVIRRIQKAMKK